MRYPNEIYPCGTKVKKLSGKPFKSGLHYNTVKSITEHPQKIDPKTNKGVPAYTFFEDDSIVESASVTSVNLREYSHNADNYYLDGIVKKLTYNPNQKENPIVSEIKGNCVRQLIDTIQSNSVNGQKLMLFGLILAN